LIIGETTGVVEGTVEELYLDAGKVEEAKAQEIFSVKVSNKVRKNDKFFTMEPAAAVAN
jgi:putative protease